AVGGDLVGVEAVEGAPERLALAQDRRPRQARLERLQREALEEAALVADRHAPLGVVVLPQERVARRPRRPQQTVLAAHQVGARRVRHLSQASGGAASNVRLSGSTGMKVVSTRAARAITKT